MNCLTKMKRGSRATASRNSPCCCDRRVPFKEYLNVIFIVFDVSLIYAYIVASCALLQTPISRLRSLHNLEPVSQSVRIYLTLHSHVATTSTYSFRSHFLVIRLLSRHSPIQSSCSHLTDSRLHCLLPQPLQHRVRPVCLIGWHSYKRSEMPLYHRCELMYLLQLAPHLQSRSKSHPQGSGLRLAGPHRRLPQRMLDIGLE